MARGVCSIDGCERPHRAMGYCGTHYASHRFLGQQCEGEKDCPCTPRAGGLCNVHIDKRRSPCKVDGCERSTRAKGYCASHWKALTGAPRTCRHCGESFAKQGQRTFCSDRCRRLSLRSPVRQAVESGDYAAILSSIKASTVTDENGCWLWTAAKSGPGYGVIGQGAMGGLVHRHALEASLGRPLGKQTVHHRCAVRACCNPDHLQLVTQRENTAEMFERNYYIRRIAVLEAALMDVAPDHPALAAMTGS